MGGGLILRMGQFGGCVIVGGGGVKRCGVFNNMNMVQFVKLFGQVLCGESDKLKGEERLRLHIPVVAVVMLDSRVARCVHCVENVA